MLPKPLVSSTTTSSQIEGLGLGGLGLLPSCEKLLRLLVGICDGLYLV